AITARLTAAEADLASLANGTRGPLRIALYQSVGARILPRLLHQFRTAWPQVEIRLLEGLGDAEMLAMVERGALDLAITTLPLAEGPFMAVELLRDPYVLVVPAASPMARQKSLVRLEDLTSLDLIGITSCRVQVESLLRAAGVRTKIDFYSSDNRVVQALVAAGMGAAL